MRRRRFVPAGLSAQQRRREVVDLFARGLARLRTGVEHAAAESPEIPPNPPCFPGQPPAQCDPVVNGVGKARSEP